MSPALALGAITSSAAAACGVRGGIFTESFLCDFTVLQLSTNPPLPEGPPPPPRMFCSVDLEAHVHNLVSDETQVIGVFMDGRCVFQT
jgi:hypothetical protein